MHKLNTYIQSNCNYTHIFIQDTKSNAYHIHSIFLQIPRNQVPMSCSGDSFYMLSCHTPTCLGMHLCTCKGTNYNDSLPRQMRIAQRRFHVGEGSGLSLKNLFLLGFRLRDLVQTLQHHFKNTFSRKNAKFPGVDSSVINSAGLDTSDPPPPPSRR